MLTSENSQQRSILFWVYKIKMLEYVNYCVFLVLQGFNHYFGEELSGTLRLVLTLTTREWIEMLSNLNNHLTYQLMYLYARQYNICICKVNILYE